MSSPSKAAADELGLSGLSNALWLVKLPKFVSELWAEAKDGDVLGQLSSVSVRDPSTSQVVKKLSVSIPESEGMASTIGLLSFLCLISCSIELGNKPMQFTLDELGNFLNQSNDLLAFVHDPDRERYSVAGRCTKSLVLKPKDNSQYHELRKKRVLAEQVRKESQYLAASDIAGRRVTAADYIVNPSNSSSSSKRIKQEIDPSMIRNRIFTAFAKDNKVLFADILASCKDMAGISADSLRPVLETYATFHKKGQYHSYWELKPEYRSKQSS